MFEFATRTPSRWRKSTQRLHRAYAKTEAYPCGMDHSMLKRIHNPHGYTCACLSSCWCRRTRLGEAVRWYVPSRFHRLPKLA